MIYVLITLYHQPLSLSAQKYKKSALFLDASGVLLHILADKFLDFLVYGVGRFLAGRCTNKISRFANFMRRCGADLILRQRTSPFRKRIV